MNEEDYWKFVQKSEQHRQGLKESKKRERQGSKPSHHHLSLLSPVKYQPFLKMFLSQTLITLPLGISGLGLSSFGRSL